MAQTDVDFCSAALVKLGAAPITSFQEPRTEAEIAKRLYPIVRDGLLGAHPWVFSMSQMRLMRAEETPLGDFAHAFELPADLLRTISAGTGQRGRGALYRIAGGRLHSDAGDILLTYQRRSAEDDFSAHFVSALIARLAAEFCLPVTENAGRSEILHRLAAAELRLARLLDSQQAPPRVVGDVTLLAARLS
jgi:hypothetical protein